jgi:hypothetical protein
VERERRTARPEAESTCRSSTPACNRYARNAGATTIQLCASGLGDRYARNVHADASARASSPSRLASSPANAR